MEYHSVKRHTSLFRNGVSLSKIILLGTPKLHTIFSLKKLVTELPVAFFIATASTYLVNCSVATNIHAHLSEGGFIGPMERIWSYSWMETLAAGVYLISSPFTFLTFLGEVLGIYLHCRPVVSLV